MELTVERNGHKVAGFQADVRPDDRARMAGLLEGWLSGQKWDRALWAEFSIVGMDGWRRVEVRTDGRQP